MAILSNVYTMMSSALPVAWINSYYVYKNRERPDSWLNYPFYLLHVPKAAGTSICEAIQMPDSGHLLFDEMRVETARNLARKPSLMVVRDPLDRLVSTYTYSLTCKQRNIRHLVGFIAEYRTLDDFLTAVINRNDLRQHYFLRSAHSFYRSALSFGAKVDIIRLEDVNDVFPKYIESLGLPVRKLPRKRVSRELRPSGFIPPEITNKINDLFAQDIDLRMKAWPK